MWTLTSSLILGFASAGTLACFLGWQHRLRMHRISLLKKNTSELLPNCLLTRAPIVFVSGPRSVFYSSRYWNFIPDFLDQHGYATFLLEINTRRPSARASSLRSHLDRLPCPSHVVCEAKTFADARLLGLENHVHVASWSVMSLAKTQKEFAEAKAPITPIQPTIDRPNHQPAQQQIYDVLLSARPESTFTGFATQVLATGHEWLTGYPLLAKIVGFQAGAHQLEVERQYLRHAILLAEQELQSAE